MIIRRTGARIAPALPTVPFDSTYGYRLDDLLNTCGPPDTEPPDLDLFWAGIRAETLAVDPRPEIGRWEPVGPDGHSMAPIRVSGLDQVRLAGWLVRSPGSLRRALVIGHGYGGRAEPQLRLPEGCLSIQLSARGLIGSEHPGIGDSSQTHVLSGIGSVRSYSHTGSTADQWTATTVLADLAGDVPIGYEGGSFGGGIGVLAAAYEDRFDAIAVEVPSFGNHRLRLTLPGTGSGEQVRLYAADHPEVIEVLRYVDAATAATRVRVPVLCIAALADPAVPPPGQFAVANSFAGATWLHVLPAGHAEWDGEPRAQADSDRRISEFWADPSAAVRSRSD
ncbi:acetylxylan esterase [Nakamurella lactea]|uniref:acetylxylan esterase n=1 Tax=Nakamurella lactea TaxID=459515 RepID=UPI00041F81AE|nr:acetylxylan esterase [Nakamurella lactea]